MHFLILRSAHTFKSGAQDELVQQGWISVLARGNARGAKAAMAAFSSAERAAR